VTQDWTDFNAHDPGITVLELLAYTVEALLVVATVRWFRSRRCHRTGSVR
jgi:hypothetical protein